MHHRAFIEDLLTKAGARGYRTDASVLIAAPQEHGWLIDDAYVAGEQWAGADGQVLWDALVADCAGAAVRFVCPTYDVRRAAFAASVGLTVAESWWLKELAGSSSGQSGFKIDLPDAGAFTVAAPPIYAPPGPILFLPASTDAVPAVAAVIEQAPMLGCAAIVVNQRAGESALPATLAEAGFRRHCDLYIGTV